MDQLRLYGIQRELNFMKDGLNMDNVIEKNIQPILVGNQMVILKDGLQMECYVRKKDSRDTYIKPTILYYSDGQRKKIKRAQNKAKKLLRQQKHAEISRQHEELLYYRRAYRRYLIVAPEIPDGNRYCTVLKYYVEPLHLPSGY